MKFEVRFVVDLLSVSLDICDRLRTLILQVIHHAYL
jgi:hypothetical protein